MSSPSTEAELREEILGAAAELGIRCRYVPDSRRLIGGWPDLELVGAHVEWWELKSETGELSPEQKICLKALEDAGAIVRVVRPHQWPIVIRGMLASIAPVRPLRRHELRRELEHRRPVAT